MKVDRILLAFLIAPLVVPVVIFLDSISRPHVGTFLPPTSLKEAFSIIFLYGLIALPAAYFAELVVGVPAWLLLRHYKVRSYLAFIGTGALLGLCFHLLVVALSAPFIFMFTGQSPTWISSALEIEVPAASACAMVFRMIAFSDAQLRT